MARSSSGLGRRPLKAEITGSTPVRATNFIMLVIIEITDSSEGIPLGDPVRATTGKLLFPFFVKYFYEVTCPDLKNIFLSAKIKEKRGIPKGVVRKKVRLKSVNYLK